MATKLQVKGSWNEVKAKLKQKYGQLTDDDLSFAERKKMRFWDVFNDDWESPKRIFALRSRNYSQTVCSAFGLASPSPLINHQAQMAAPAANSAPANMTARKPATKE